MILLLATLLISPQDPADLIETAIPELIKMEEGKGEWPYEGVYRVGGKIPIGYRVGGTSIVCDALLHSGDKKAMDAVERGLAFVLKGLDDKLMVAGEQTGYDVRVWGHIYALEFLCHVRAEKAAGKKKKEVDAAIKKLVKDLITEQLPDGGWNYSSLQNHSAFVTGPAVQALLLARSQKEKVPAAVFDRAKKILKATRTDEGAYRYSGALKGATVKLPGSIARSAVCETTLLLLGDGSTERIQAALDAFHKHWEELEKRRKKTGTHKGPYGIAPYYFYFGHRYAAQAIEFLPKKDRKKERERLLKVILKTRDEDGTWNDRVFERSRNYGTAMIVLALLGKDAPLPPALKEKK